MEQINFILNCFFSYYKTFLFFILLIFLINILFKLYKKLEIRNLTKSNFMNLSYIRTLDGYQFEAYVEKQLKNLGFKASKTSSSYDFGVDLFLEDKYAVQLKNYTSSVGISAVQEIYAGAHYFGKIPVVIATNYYTKSAIALASKLNIELIDLDDIKNWGNRSYTRSFPETSGLYELVATRLASKIRKEIFS